MRFVVKEIAVLREGNVLAHYMFASPIPWNLLTKADKSRASYLGVHHHGLLWEDGMIPYSMAKRLITTAVIGTEDDGMSSPPVYVKGCQKREWLADMLDNDERENITIQTLDADYEDIESLNNLDATNTMRCGKHIRNCALQNVFKIFNWWSQHHKDL